MSKVVFKCAIRRPLRRRRSSIDEDADADEGELVDGAAEEINKEALQETIELQKLRKRGRGLNVLALNMGKKLSRVEEAVSDDPFKIKSGGLLDLQRAKQAKAAMDDEGMDDGGGVGTQFSKETRVRDEDEEMRKFIETEVENRTGKREIEDAEKTKEDKYMAPEEAALMALPDALRKSTFAKNEEMLSSAMLSGIPEVDLGIEEKIRNIEATEAAKKAAAERAKTRTRPSEMVPSNVAVNFRLPDKFKAELFEGKTAIGTNTAKPAVPRVSVAPVVRIEKTVVVGELPVDRIITEAGPKPMDPTKASDDLHLLKFRSHFQRK